MSIDLPHLASALFNRPHMIAGHKLDVILSAIAPRLFDGGKLPARAFVQDEAQDMPCPESYRVTQGVAIIPVHGTLVRRGCWLDSASGLTSYEGLLASFREAIIQPDVKAILLDIDSAGGEAGGVFDLVEEMRRLSTQHNKPIWAHANEQAASAAYAIACSAEKIWVARTGDVGSIGVVCAHIDQSKYDEKQGVKWTYIYCGAHKTHANPHEPLADVARAKIQADSDLLYEMFVQLVVDYRPMSASQVHDTKADTFIGRQALTFGLTDHVGTFDEALGALAAQLHAQDKTRKGTDKWPSDTGSKMSAMKSLKKKRKSTTVQTRSSHEFLAVLSPSPLNSARSSLSIPCTHVYVWICCVLTVDSL